jgi:hypothetical protein
VTGTGRSAFVIGAALGAAIWLLSPAVTGRREPWDAAGGYYVGALFGAGLVGGLIAPSHWLGATLGIFAGQALVLLAPVVADPSDGGLWPLGLLFLGAASAVALVGACVGAAVGRRRGDP